MMIENGVLTYGLRCGDFVVDKDNDRIDHAMRIDRIMWSTYADVTYVTTGWKGRVYLTDVRKITENDLE